MMDKPIETLAFFYPMTQFLINSENLVSIRTRLYLLFAREKIEITLENTYCGPRSTKKHILLLSSSLLLVWVFSCERKKQPIQ